MKVVSRADDHVNVSVDVSCAPASKPRHQILRKVKVKPRQLFARTSGFGEVNDYRSCHCDFIFSKRKLLFSCILPSVCNKHDIIPDRRLLCCQNDFYSRSITCEGDEGCWSYLWTVCLSSTESSGMYNHLYLLLKRSQCFPVRNNTFLLHNPISFYRKASISVSYHYVHLYPSDLSQLIIKITVTTW